MVSALSAVLLPALLFAEPSTDQALQSLLRVKAAAEAASAADAARSVQLNAVPYDNASPSAPALPVQGASGQKASEPPSTEKPAPKTAQPTGHISGGYLGLYPEDSFTVTTGRCADCNAPKEGMWYFLDEVVAVPKAGPPAIVWLGSHDLIEGARLSKDGKTITLPDGSSIPFALVPKLASNLSYYDEATTSYLQGRALRLRGEFALKDGVRTFVARTIWPEDDRVDFAKAPSFNTDKASDITKLEKQDNGGAQAPFEAKVLWENGAGRAWGGKAVMGVMLNGSQGDDDETHGGHFSFFTGRFGPNGEMSDWMFNNFYDMDQVSEKGILPSLVPMDKYMGDVNSGQSWYRPSYVLVAVLKSDKPASELQEKYKALYSKYYSHQVLYNHTTNSCAGLVIDELRKDGWEIPKVGPSNIFSSVGLSALVGIGAFSPKKGEDMWAAMRQERTRLFPRPAFEQAGQDLVRLGEDKTGRKLGPFEQELAQDLEAVLFVRIPQIPSSRAWGNYPVASSEEYFHRVPANTSKWKQGGPTSPRPYPPPH